MQGFIILAIIGTEQLITTESDGQTQDRRTEIGTPISHPAMFVCLFDLILYDPSTIFQLNWDGKYFNIVDRCGILP